MSQSKNAQGAGLWWWDEKKLAKRKKSLGIIGTGKERQGYTSVFLGRICGITTTSGCYHTAVVKNI